MNHPPANHPPANYYPANYPNANDPLEHVIPVQISAAIQDRINFFHHAAHEALIRGNHALYNVHLSVLAAELNRATTPAACPSFAAEATPPTIRANATPPSLGIHATPATFAAPATYAPYQAPAAPAACK
jgi:hypothetical protein